MTQDKPTTTRAIATYATKFPSPPHSPLPTTLTLFQIDKIISSLSYLYLSYLSRDRDRKRWYKSWAESRLRPHATLRRPLFLRGAGAIC
jgi:hypothetical protein